MIKVLLFGGRKSSGKSTLGNFLTRNVNEIFPPGFILRSYNFADSLKKTVSELFDVPLEDMYTSEETKNKPTRVKWKNLPYYGKVCLQTDCGVSEERAKEIIYSYGEAPLTIRELLQQFGTNICRSLYSDCWVSKTKKEILADRPDMACIMDARFLNEIEYFQNDKQIELCLLRLTRKITDTDIHISETQLDDYPFPKIIDNANMTISQSQDALIKVLKELNWI